MIKVAIDIELICKKRDVCHQPDGRDPTKRLVSAAVASISGPHGFGVYRSARFSTNALLMSRATTEPQIDSGDLQGGEPITMPQPKTIRFMASAKRFEADCDLWPKITVISVTLDASFDATHLCVDGRCVASDIAAPETCPGGQRGPGQRGNGPSGGSSLSPPKKMTP